MNNEALLEQLNKFTRKELSAEEVYIFPVTLCDNEIDRDNERFSRESLEKMAEKFIGVTGIFDHDPKGGNQTARLFMTEVVEEERENSLGEKYAYLKGHAYMVRTDSNADLIREIEGGIKKEVSVSCSVKKELCSICGADMKKSPCTHIKGAVYGDKVCCVILDEPYDAYEWSFVAVPAQKNAGVTKKYGNTEKDSDAVEVMKSQLAQARQENAVARDIIKREILRLSFLCNPVITVKTVGILTENMDFNQLLELKESLERDLQEKNSNEEKISAKSYDKNHNDNFKIN